MKPRQPAAENASIVAPTAEAVPYRAARSRMQARTSCALIPRRSSWHHRANSRSLSNNWKLAAEQLEVSSMRQAHGGRIPAADLARFPEHPALPDKVLHADLPVHSVGQRGRRWQHPPLATAAYKQWWLSVPFVKTGLSVPAAGFGLTPSGAASHQSGPYLGREDRPTEPSACTQQPGL